MVLFKHKKILLMLGVAMLFSGTAKAQMLDDEEGGNWGGAMPTLDFQMEGEETADALVMESSAAQAPDMVSSETAEKNAPASLGGASLEANLPTMAAENSENATRSEVVSWSNDATPPERIYESKEIRMGADGLLHEIETGKLVNGEVRERYPSGKLLSKVRFVDGAKQGRALMLFENGTLLSEAFYQDGKENGDVSAFYADGNERLKVTFKDGEPVSGYCMTADGLKMEMTTVQLRAFQDEGKIPCDR